MTKVWAIPDNSQERAQTFLGRSQQLAEVVYRQFWTAPLDGDGCSFWVTGDTTHGRFLGILNVPRRTLELCQDAAGVFLLPVLDEVTEIIRDSMEQNLPTMKTIEA